MPRRDLVVTLAMVAATMVLFVLMANHASMAAIQRFDDAVLRRMLSIRSGWLTSLGKFFNVVGSVYVTLPVRILIAGYLVLRRRWWHLATFASAMILAEISSTVLKSLYDRARPPGSLVHTSGASFPSGHAVATSVTAVAIVIALFPEGPRRFVWGAVAVAFSLFMALSRAYLAAHWLSDAVAGVLLGTSIALGTAVVVHSIRASREKSPFEPAAPGLRLPAGSS
jgi:undecaprenyl-diphosphatase